MQRIVYINIPSEGPRAWRVVKPVGSESWTKAVKRTIEEALCWIWYQGYDGTAFVKTVA